MYIHHIVVTSRNSVSINTSITHCMISILFIQSFVVDTIRIYTIERSAYMSYSHNNQKFLKFHTGITSKDPALKLMTSSMIKVRYTFIPNCRLGIA